MRASQILPSSFLDNLGPTEHIAVDVNGHVICRATTRAAVEAAVANAGSGDAVAFFSGAEIAGEPIVPKAGTKRAFDIPNEPFVASETVIVATSATVATAQGGPEKAPPVDNEHVAPDATAFTEVEIAANAPADMEPVETPVAEVPPETHRPVADGTAFDHDSDGRVGGSLAGGNRKRRPSK